MKHAENKQLDTEIEALKAEVSQLRAAIERAIQQHEEGNRGAGTQDAVRGRVRGAGMKVEMGRVYRTRDGREVRIYAVDGLGNREVHGAIYTPNDGWEHRAWFPDGMMYTYPSGADLVEVRPRIKREVWVNVYPHRMGVPHGNKAYVDTHRGADAIACVRVEIDVEEGHGL